MTTYRYGCGTFLGARLHQEAGEELCGDCAHRERVLALEAEAARPTPPDPGLTEAEARRNCTELAHALEGTRHGT